MRPIAVALPLLTVLALATPAGADDEIQHRVLATSKTSTMEKELRDAGEAGFRFAAVMGGETAFGGSEVVVLMSKRPGDPARYRYKLLASTKTSTMQSELQAAADDGYEYVGQTVFTSLFGGDEVVTILERPAERTDMAQWDYKLVATSKTSTLQKELGVAGGDGYEVVGMTIGTTAMGGSELVTIMRRRRER
jgi:hypothetical protein